MPNTPGKRSYHQSGKVHSQYADGSKRHEAWAAPLSEFTGAFHLNTLAVSNSDKFFDVVSPEYDFTGKKSDVTLTIDNRTLPENVIFNAIVGILEPGRGDLLSKILEPIPEDLAGMRIRPQQILLATSVIPWIYVILSLVDNVRE